MRRLVLAVTFAIQGCAPAEPQLALPDPEFTRLMRAKSETPSFAGLRSDQGALTVFIFDEAQREAASATLTTVFDGTPPAIVSRPARGGAHEGMKNTATDVLSVPGIHLLDFDETSGYLRIGMSKASALEPAQEKLLELSVSLEAVILEPRRVFRAGN